MAEVVAPEVERVALRARAFLEPVWRSWYQSDGKPMSDCPSRGTCGRSSLFLQRALVHAGIPAVWRSGSPHGGRQIGCFDGVNWHGHAWVETDGWIVDITADQFGGPPVLVVQHPDARYRADTIDAASSEAIARRHRRIDEIWPQWLDRMASDGTAPPIRLPHGPASR